MLQTYLSGLSTKSMERHSHKPGQHGQNLRRKTSDFGLQLAEKQEKAQRARAQREADRGGDNSHLVVGGMSREEWERNHGRAPRAATE